MIKIKNLFDSHVHWLATGSSDFYLPLHQVKTLADLKCLVPKNSYFRGPWLIGRGWDQHQLQFELNSKTLDEVFPDFPVYFRRIDGHAACINSSAIKTLRLLHQKDIYGGHIEKDNEGFPTGILIDNAMEIVNKSLPPFSETQIENALLNSSRIFNNEGFTHIRDLSCDEMQWNISIKLFQQNKIHLAVEQFFDAGLPEYFDQKLKLLIKAKTENHPFIRPKGIKVYFDGALGSEGALLSDTYPNGKSGLQLLKNEVLKEMIIRTWESKAEIAVHTIGDEASFKVAKILEDLYEKGYRGKLHLEHIELIRPETIKILKNKNVICHIQPCHFLSDKKWIDQKIKKLKPYLFPFKELEENNIQFDFGSDSPVEPTSYKNNFIAINEINEMSGSKLKHNLSHYHCHQDETWMPGCETIFNEDLSLNKIIFKNKPIFFD